MKPIYARSKVLLVPSICHEGFGRIIIEANINQVPVIASNVGGIKEAMGDGQVIIDDYLNINCFIDELNYLLNNYDWYKQLKKEALKNSIRFQETNLIQILNQFKV
ncbi:Glycosyl transferases group 1 [Paramaledivibacter caminithermalis DSM 15212]|jgi:glycosyltransferase involved in cell wall biosynthesis|uniref:Glycosyl transferases group 1 n=2 Tax=Paramaledivibacter TaxID=1884934 RepID=A0A1M6MTK5_PARC5|nr:Glycosyl transferases group 1 [Paramaledivibacter caminithermalis DSM 15212]